MEEAIIASIAARTSRYPPMPPTLSTTNSTVSKRRGSEFTLRGIPAVAISVPLSSTNDK
jgi:hypothetical protein